MSAVTDTSVIDRMKEAYAQYGAARTQSKLEEEAAGRVPLPTIERSLLAQVRIQKAISPDRTLKLKAPLVSVDGVLKPDPDFVTVIKKVERKLTARTEGESRTVASTAAEAKEIIKDIAPSKPTRRVRERAKAGGVKITAETIALSKDPSLILDKLKEAAARVRKEEPLLEITEGFTLPVFEWPKIELPTFEWPDWSNIFKRPETPDPEETAVVEIVPEETQMKDMLGNVLEKVKQIPYVATAGAAVVGLGLLAWKLDWFKKARENLI